MILVSILAAVLLLFGVSVLVGTLGYRRGREPAAIAGAAARSLQRPDSAALPVFVASVELRRDLEAALATGEAIVGVDRYVDADSRGPLWRRLNEAGFRQALAAAEPALRRWLGLVDGLPPVERALVDPATPAITALVGVVDPDAGGPSLPAALGALARAQVALVEIEAALASHQPKGYR